MDTLILHVTNHDTSISIPIVKMHIYTCLVYMYLFLDWITHSNPIKKQVHVNKTCIFTMGMDIEVSWLVTCNIKVSNDSVPRFLVRGVHHVHVYTYKYLHLLNWHILYTVNTQIRPHWTGCLLVRGQRLLLHVLSAHLTRHVTVVAVSIVDLKVTIVLFVLCIHAW